MTRFLKNPVAKILATTMLVLGTSNLCAWWGSNAPFPYDSAMLQSSPLKEDVEWGDGKRDSRFKFDSGVSVSLLFDGKGRNGKEREVELYQIYSPIDSATNQPAESYGGFFEGADKANPSLEFQTRFFGGNPGVDVGSVGIKGTRTESHINFYSSVATHFDKLPGTIRLSAYAPIKLVHTNPKPIQNIGAGAGAADLTTESKIASALKEVGELSIREWSQDNVFGDFWLMGSWQNMYEQDHEWLTKVGLMLQVGVTYPMGDMRYQDNIYAVPMGLDGSIGIPVSGCIDVYIKELFKASVFADFYTVFDDSNRRRIKKVEANTELLIPNKVLVRRNGGSILRISAMIDFNSPGGYWWGQIGYQYGKKNEEHVTTEAEGYSNDLINASERWQEAEWHNMLASIGIDLSRHIERLSPKLNVGLQWPLKGKRCAMFKIATIGLNMTF